MLCCRKCQTVKRCTVCQSSYYSAYSSRQRAAMNQICSPRPDLRDTPLIDAELELFVDSSESRDQTTGVNKVGYAVVTQHETLKAKPLPSHFSVQAA